ncbi:hypothetical protein ABZ281_20370, partial [Streptomyces sp. NPDC006265]
MDYCDPCRRHLNGALACPGCGTSAETLRRRGPEYGGYGAGVAGAPDVEPERSAGPDAPDGSDYVRESYAGYDETYDDPHADADADGDGDGDDDGEHLGRAARLTTSFRPLISSPVSVKTAFGSSLSLAST